MPDDPKPYDIDPTTEKPAPPPLRPIEPKGKLDEPALLKHFPEDADFDRDPEVERALAGGRGQSTRSRVAAPADSMKVPLVDFVKPGLGEPMQWVIVGAVLLVTAMVVTGVTSPGRTAWRVLQVFYMTLLHAGTGLVAIYVAAALARQFVGRVDLAAARMFGAVAAFAVVFSLNLRLAGSQGLDATIKLALASGVYVAIVALTFKLFDRRTLGTVVGIHFALWLVVQIAMELAVAASRAPAPSAP